MVEPKWTPALTKAAQETGLTIARLQSDLDGRDSLILTLQYERDAAKAENVRLRANTTIDWTPEINRLRNEVIPAIEAERDEALAQLADVALTLLEFREHVLENATQWVPEGGSHHHPIWQKVAAAISDGLPTSARAMLEVVKAAVKMYEECPPDSPRSVTEWRGYWRELGAAVAHYNATRETHD